MRTKFCNASYQSSCMEVPDDNPIISWDSHTSRSGLLGPSVLPVHHKRGADIGRSLYWEQRYCTSCYLSDARNGRKSEKRYDTLDNMRNQWELHDTDYLQPTDIAACGIKCTVFNTAFLFWLVVL